jgi:hypothetical protein
MRNRLVTKTAEIMAMLSRPDARFQFWRQTKEPPPVPDAQPPFGVGDEVALLENWMLNTLYGQGKDSTCHIKYFYRATDQGFITPPQWRRPQEMPQDAVRFIVRIDDAQKRRLSSMTDDEMCDQMDVPRECDRPANVPYKRDIPAAFRAHWVMLHNRGNFYAPFNDAWCWVLSTTTIEAKS